MNPSLGDPLVVLKVVKERFSRQVQKLKIEILWQQEPDENRSGKSGSTISMCGVRTNRSRN
jgi:hypothetical protein